MSRRASARSVAGALIMTARTAFLILILLAGCATSREPAPSATSAVVPAADAASSPGPPVDIAPAPRRTYRTRPSDVALSVVATPFVFGFRAVVCAASAVVAAPAAALFAVSDDPRDGFAYLRYGLANNCGPPYAVPLPSAADRAREPQFVRYVPAPVVLGYTPEAPVARYPGAPEPGPPRPLTPYTGAVSVSP
jgi:hypothetical protein